MRRREFTAGIVGVVAWGMSSATARSQQPEKTRRLAFVVTTTPLAKLNEADHMPYRALVEELRRRGFAEGRNLVIDRHTGEGRPERFPQLAREVVGLKPDVIVATTEELALALRAATTSIPIVVSSTDPVSKGLVKSLAHPGGNVTGVAIDVSLESVVKLFELMKEIDPRVTRVGFLTGTVSVGSRSEAWHASVRRRVADHFGIEIVGTPLPGPWQEPQYRQAVATMVQEGAQALVVDGIAPNGSTPP
jgi:putative tryptophan/tyrosine transport system substrate-binding protein